MLCRVLPHRGPFHGLCRAMHQGYSSCSMKQDQTYILVNLKTSIRILINHGIPLNIFIHLFTSPKGEKRIPF